MEKHQTKCDFEAIFYGMVDWVWELDSNWIYTMVDGNIHEKTKYSTDELINHSFFSFFRITSYNVCYTKLLRVKAIATEPKAA